MRTAALAAVPIRRRVSRALHQAGGRAHGDAESDGIRQRRTLPSEGQKEYPGDQPPIHFYSVPRRANVYVVVTMNPRFAHTFALPQIQ